MEPITWTVTEPNGKTSVQDSTKKHEFVKEIDIPSDMPDGQKSFAQSYNSMRETLLSNGMMNKK